MLNLKCNNCYSELKFTNSEYNFHCSDITCCSMNKHLLINFIDNKIKKYSIVYIQNNNTFYIKSSNHKTYIMTCNGKLILNTRFLEFDSNEFLNKELEFISNKIKLVLLLD